MQFYLAMCSGVSKTDISVKSPIDADNYSNTDTTILIQSKNISIWALEMFFKLQKNFFFKMPLNIIDYLGTFKRHKTRYGGSFALKTP